MTIRGGAMGMATISISLWKYIMDYSAPQNPTFFNRDRFVLPNGHTCLFQYIFQGIIDLSRLGAQLGFGQITAIAKLGASS